MESGLEIFMTLVSEKCFVLRRQGAPFKDETKLAVQEYRTLRTI
jgi:hypothetical protein